MTRRARSKRPASRFRPFTDARAFARALGLPNRAAWGRYSRGELVATLGEPPDDLPRFPDQHYRDAGWSDWGDFLGTGNMNPTRRHEQFRAFASARRFARELDLSSREEWTCFCRGELPEKGLLPPNIPVSPDSAYRRMGWTDWGDFLGTFRVANQLRVFRSFEDARAYARDLDLASQNEWLAHCKRLRAEGRLPHDLSLVPDKTYKRAGWTGWGDFLGTGNPNRGGRSFRAFEDARAFARALGLRTVMDWKRFLHGERPDLGPVPTDLPVKPEQTYRDSGWVSWPDFLRAGAKLRIRLREWLPFEEARRFVRSLELGSARRWPAYMRGELKGKPPRPAIPWHPEHVYRDEGWISWTDFLRRP